MSNLTLVIGESGTGKSTSMANLDCKETFVINVINKPMPFRGSHKKYIPIKNWNDKEGNLYASDDYEQIMNCIKMVNTTRPEIKTLIIDDFQYVMGNEFMRRCLERGYDKFSEIGSHAWMIMTLLKNLRADLDCFVLSHSEPNELGKMKIKTVGKMLDDKISLEGMVTTLLQTEVSDGKYSFITQGDARHIAKSPMGMLDRTIPNDLQLVKSKMNEYFNEDIAQ
jgi:hypothetical protein